MKVSIDQDLLGIVHWLCFRMGEDNPTWLRQIFDQVKDVDTYIANMAFNALSMQERQLLVQLVETGKLDNDSLKLFRRRGFILGFDNKIPGHITKLCITYSKVIKEMASESK